MLGAPQESQSDSKDRLPTVLCVDDEVIGLEIRRVVLEREGYRVLTAPDGPNGLEIFASHPVDAVVLDYSMPGMNGGEVAAQMRAKKPAVPILLLSAYTSMPPQVLEIVDSFVVKGEGAPRLLQKLAHLLSSKTTLHEGNPET